MKNSRI